MKSAAYGRPVKTNLVQELVLPANQDRDDDTGLRTLPDRLRDPYRDDHGDADLPSDLLSQRRRGWVYDIDPGDLLHGVLLRGLILYSWRRLSL